MVGHPAQLSSARSARQNLSAAPPQLGTAFLPPAPVLLGLESQPGGCAFVGARAPDAKAASRAWIVGILDSFTPDSGPSYCVPDVC